MALRQIGTILTACERFGVPTESIPTRLHDVKVYVNPRLRSRLGKARFNPEHTDAYWIEIHKCVFADPDQMRKTLAHEVAHVIAGISQGHGRRWQLIARGLGHSGERCVTAEAAESIGITKQTRATQIVGRCGRCGFEILRTRKLQSGKRFRHIACGGRIEAVE